MKTANKNKGTCVLSKQQRMDNVDNVIQRFFVGQSHNNNLEREAIARNINPGDDFIERFIEEQEIAEGGFGTQLLAPSTMVYDAFLEYAQTDLGAVVVCTLLLFDQQFIDRGWRNNDGSLTEDGILAYGAGIWKPFCVASSGEDSDAVTPSGVLTLPDIFEDEYYSTGDLSNPLAIIHHELKAHVIPLKEKHNIEPGLEMELICVRLETEILLELGLPKRQLNWGRDDGILDHTLHEPSENYYQGLVRQDESGKLVEVDPVTEAELGWARIK